MRPRTKFTYLTRTNLSMKSWIASCKKLIFLMFLAGRETMAWTQIRYQDIWVEEKTNHQCKWAMWAHLYSQIANRILELSPMDSIITGDYRKVNSICLKDRSINHSSSSGQGWSWTNKANKTITTSIPSRLKRKKPLQTSILSNRAILEVLQTTLMRILISLQRINNLFHKYHKRFLWLLHSPLPYFQSAMKVKAMPHRCPTSHLL